MGINQLEQSLTKIIHKDTQGYQQAKHWVIRTQFTRQVTEKKHKIDIIHIPTGAIILTTKK